MSYTMMDTNEIVQSTDLVVISNISINGTKEPTLKVLFGNPERNNTMHYGLEILHHFHTSIQKENLLIEAIQNLIKKNEFLQLNYRLADKQISDEEFDEELNINTDTYLIDMKELDDQKKLFVISSILNRINRNFTTHEVSELFAIDLNSLNHTLNKLIR